ncbi:MAG: PH domain-containing protein [Rudaea sp.]
MPIHTVNELPLIDAGRKPAFSIGLIILIIFLVLIGVGIGVYRDPPVSPNVLPLTILIIVATCVTSLALVRVVARVRAFVHDDELVLQTGVGTRRVALANLRSHGVEVIDLRRHEDLTPRLRLWGASMPGLTTGWLRLRNGEKSVCLLTDRRRVAYLRSEADNLTLLLSLQNPETLKALIDR